MPPQQENETAAETAPATAAADATSTEGGSYWDAPNEKELEGKRLSKLDLSSLEHQHIADGEKEGEKTDDDDDDEKTEKNKPESYWDAPAEKGLEGKRLSKLDLSTMEHQHVDDAAAASTEMPSKKKSFGAYWEWQNEQFKKTLSNLSLSNLAKQHDGTESTAQESETTENGATPTPTVQGANYWEWQGEKLKQTLSNLSLSNLAKGSRAEEEGEDGMGPRRQSNGSYWFWRNASMRSMDASNASLTALEQAAKDGDAALTDSERSTGSGGSPSRRAGGSYWFWKGGSSTNNLNSSNASLSALDEKVKNSERAKNNPVEESSGSTGFPITNLQHKLRNSWRQSFQRFSTNSLRKLDESTPVEEGNKKGWKDAMAGKGRLGGMNDSFDGGSCSSGEDDAITF